MFGWTAVGIRTKILVPLILLMLLSLFGSTLGFIISTNTTRNSIIDTQLQEDERRIRTAFQQSTQDARESAEKLADDLLLINGLVKERVQPDINRSREMSERVQPVQERFNLDQVLVFDAQHENRVNIGPSHLEHITVVGSDLLPVCNQPEQWLVTYNEAPLLVFCAPILADEVTARTNDFIGNVYTILDVPTWLERTRRERELDAEVALMPPGEDEARDSVGRRVRPQTATSSNDYRARQMMIPLEDEPESLRIALMLDTHHINEILESGLRVTLVSSGLTLLFVLAVGLWLARSFTRPIFKLVAVAQAMAEGDLTSRANLSHHDEIGQLGRAVDQAIITIANLLDQQARAAGERQAILQSIADGVLAVDNDERIIIINPTAAAILGVENDALIDQPLEYLADVSEDPTMSVGLQQIVSQIRSELVDPDMAPTEERASLGNRIVRIHSTPTLVQDQTRTGAVVVLQDITRIVEADRAKSEFIATASHELRTPLTSLKGFVDVFGLSGTDNLNDNQQMFLEIIKRQTDSMVQMVNDLLEVARLEQGIQRAERRWVHPEQAIAEAQTSLRSLIEQRRVTIQTDLPEKMPCIWIDYLHLRRILTNLVSNAVKYVHHGGNVWIRAYELDDPAHLSNSQHMLPWKHREERSLVFVVEDDGVGIRTEDQPKIFTRFFRSENALSVEVGGTGLGLAVTRALVELHEGQIGFWSEENQGSRFWVRMPTPSTAPLDEEQTEQLHAHAQSDHSG